MKMKVVSCDYQTTAWLMFCSYPHVLDWSFLGCENKLFCLFVCLLYLHKQFCTPIIVAFCPDYSHSNCILMKIWKCRPKVYFLSLFLFTVSNKVSVSVVKSCLSLWSIFGQLDSEDKSDVSMSCLSTIAKPTLLTLSHCSSAGSPKYLDFPGTSLIMA